MQEHDRDEEDCPDEEHDNGNHRPPVTLLDVVRTGQCQASQATGAHDEQQQGDDRRASWGGVPQNRNVPEGGL